MGPVIQHHSLCDGRECPGMVGQVDENGDLPLEYLGPEIECPCECHGDIWRTVQTDLGPLSLPASYFPPPQQPCLCLTPERLAEVLGDALDMGRFVAAYDRQQWIADKIAMLQREGRV